MQRQEGKKNIHTTPYPCKPFNFRARIKTLFIFTHAFLHIILISPYKRDSVANCFICKTMLCTFYITSNFMIFYDSIEENHQL